jgi:hypothetical protein
MKDKSKTPGIKSDHSGANGSPAVGPATPNVLDNPAWRCEPSPFEPSETSPLEWWRRLPPGSLHDTERLLLLTTLNRVRVLHAGADLAAALHGNPAAAIGAALGLMPIEEITMPVDITMTALMRTALDGNASASLVMAQIIGLTDIGQGLTAELAASWLDYGERHSSDLQKFSEARIVLFTAFEERRNKGDDA